jgi:hypothetical protein
MRSNHSDHRLYQTYSLESKVINDQKDRDTISCDNFDIEPSPGLHYLSPNSNTLPAHRRPSTKRLTATVSTHNDSDGLIINGSLFTKELFQPSQTSYILDYSKSPKDLNRFLEAQKTTPKSSQLDSHLFKLSFIITLSEWHVDKELLLDYCPHECDKAYIIEQISYYKRFCFAELNAKQKNGGNLLNEPSTFIFTRTNSDGQVEYGYCRRIEYANNQITKFPTVICIGNIELL